MQSTGRVSASPTGTVTATAALSVVVIHFARLSQPVDAEALNTQVGPLPGVVTMEIGLDDSATIGYDQRSVTCDGLAQTGDLGFNVRSYECQAQRS